MAQENRTGTKARRAAACAVVLLGASVASCYATGGAEESEGGAAGVQAAVITTSYPAARHMLGPITYPENPPMGGLHNPVWQNCGIYAVPIHSEHAVHSLEHGAVWITYRPDLPAADVERLRAVAADDYMLLSPYPGLPAPVVASAWNHQLQLEGADDPRLPEFVRAYKNNPSTTPEFGATCAGGTSAPADANSLGAGPQ